MKIVFKIIENIPQREQILVKYCRSNALKPIDDYPSYAISYNNLDFSDCKNLMNSIADSGIGIVDRQFEEEPCLDCNNQKEEINTINLDDILNVVIQNDYTRDYPLNKIDI
jgi:hypothetical protein